MQEKIKISVVLCSCNGEKYIAEQIKSIIYQTHPPDELIICDDKSDDETVKIIIKLLEEIHIYYKVFCNSERLGVAKNFLKGLKESSGDYVFCSDQDDVWKQDKIEIFLKCIEKSHKDLYFSDGLLVDSKGNSLGISLWESLHFDSKEFSSEKAKKLLLKRLFVTGSAMAVSNKLIESIDIIPNGWLHDGWFSVVAVHNKSIEAINLSTFYYRQHENNVIGSAEKRIISRFIRWKKNILAHEKMRHERYLRYKNMYKTVDLNDCANLDKCINFWKDLDSLRYVTKIEGIKIIIINYFNGNYSNYYTGFKGVFSDIVGLFI